jgi:hypothetical protein
MADNLFAPPAIYNLPLVKGQDLVIDFKNKTPGSDPAEYINYDSGVTVTLIIDSDPVTTAEADITDYHAVCRIESTVSDTLAKGLLWRCVISLPGTPTTERVPVNGLTVRSDGREPR